MSNVVLETDNGIIALALDLYYKEVIKREGSPEIADRALALYLKYRDMPDE